MPTFRTTSRALQLIGVATFLHTSPALAQTGITVYNDGRVLVRRTLPVAVPKGTSTQRVELGPIDPSSLVSLDQGVIINRALFDAAEDENAVLRRLVGRKLTVERAKQGGGTETFQVTLLGVDPTRFLMPDGTVAFGSPGGALRYPADAVSTTQAATLTLTSAAGRKDLPLGWFTDGAQWMASYDVILGAKDARVTGNAVISSQTFSATDAEIQLLAGSVSRAAPAPAGYEMRDRVAMKSMNATAPMAPPAEEGAGGFHLYTLPGKATIQPGSTTSIALFDPATTAYEKRLVVRGQLPWYGFVPQQQDEQTVPVEMTYILKRPLKSPFGDKPLPGGAARIYNPDSNGRLQLVGEASFGHSAPGEDVSLYAGNAFDLTAKRVQTEYTTVPEKPGNITRTIATLGFKVTISNGSDSTQSVDVREERGGEWSVVTSSVPAEKVSSSVTRFKVTVPAKGEVVLTYTIRTGVVTPVTLVHLSDLHFGRDCDLAMIDVVEELVPTLDANAVVVSGDLTQRARHGEFQAARRFIDRMAKSAPVLTLPGNHDVQWFESPFWIRGRQRIYVKYRRWFGQDLTPTMVLPGAVIATLLTSHGVCFPSMTPNLNDMAVKGHLPLHELQRVAKIFAEAPAELARVVVLHQNVLRGKISHRMGLSRWKTAQERLIALAPDVIINGHDHEEAAAQLGDRIVVSTAGTLTHRMRGNKPSVFNVVRIDQGTVTVQHWRWQGSTFAPSDRFVFARPPRGAALPAGVTAVA